MKELQELLLQLEPYNLNRSLQARRSSKRTAQGGVMKCPLILMALLATKVSSLDQLPIVNILSALMRWRTCLKLDEPLI